MLRFMLTCCNNSNFQYIQLMANLRKYHLELFNIADNINSTFQLKGKFDCCLELVSVIWKWDPGIISSFLEDIHIICSYSKGYWITSQKISEKTSSISSRRTIMKQEKPKVKKLKKNYRFKHELKITFLFNYLR